ncbi:MAG: DegV domain-containing protein [Firmicutes bacterium ADurb.Bin182]|nr:MAG: DegV domain-containing protein [Firmicutes bacterium ADurb.Bin182]
MIRIITDSTSDISKERREETGIDILPLQINFGSESFKDGVDITNEEFYQRLEKADELPTTSQINPYEFTELFNKYINSGDDIVCITISSHLSGTYQSAVTARESVCPERIRLIDSRNATFGLGLLVEEAVRLRDSGASAIEIEAEILRLVDKVRLFAALDTLRYLKLGGRISSASAAVGSLLGIRPIISVIDGKVEAIGKAKGKNAAFGELLKQYEKDPPDPNFTIAFGHSNSPKMLEECMAVFSSVLDIEKVRKSAIGSTVGTYAGPGAVGIAYIAK